MARYRELTVPCLPIEIVKVVTKYLFFLFAFVLLNKMYNCPLFYCSFCYHNCQCIFMSLFEND